jgi:aminopeptidase N
MSKYDVHFYFLDLNIERNSTVISGNTTIESKVLVSNMDTFCFELNSNLVIDSIQLANQNIFFTRVAAITYAILPNALSVNSNLAIKIFYHGDASVTGAGAIGDGFSKGTSPSWGNSVTWSLSEPYSAYEWFPCKQFLQDKADSAWVYVTTDASNKVGSNGILKGIDTGLANNKVRYRWITNYAIDYYLISVAVAKYVDYTIYAHPAALINDSIKVVNYVYNNPATLNAFKSSIDSIPMVIEYFSDVFGLYPFYGEKYGHSMAPIGGGMEHQTMTTLGNLGSLSLNSHELMHQWFGDHVTCKTWSDIFINEGFASYGEYLVYDKFRSHQAAQTKMADVHDNVLQDPNAMVYFTDTTDVNRIFDSRLTYDKGSAVIHTLRFVMGDSLFFSGLKTFQNHYSFSTASIDDLKADLQTSSGLNLNDYFNQWLFGEGYPIFSGEYFSSPTTLYLKISHTTSSAFTPLFKTPLEIKCTSASGDTIIKVMIDQNTNLFAIPMTKNITNIEFDPNNWILNKTGTIIKNSDLVAVSTEELQMQDAVKIYPNPTENFLNIDAYGIEGTYTLKDIQGRIIFQNILTHKTCLSLASIQTGVYHLEIQSKNGKLSRKIIKI